VGPAFIIPLLAAMFLGVNMGGSGAAVAFSTAYGARVLRLDLVPGLFGLCVLAGALLAGSRVADTIGRGIIPSEAMGSGVVTVVLLAIAFSIMLANLLGVPQSTSQATVLALVGAGLYLDRLKITFLLTWIIPAWIIMPVLAYLLTHALGHIIHKPIRNTGGVDFAVLARHPILRWGVIAAACYVAFSIGANNVANATGPIASLIQKEIGADDSTSGIAMLLAMVIVAPCFAFGGSIFGPRVVKDTGTEITRFGPLGASAVSVVTGSLLLSASLLGIPSALAQLNVGAIIGLGSYKEGHSAVFSRRHVRKILVVWAVSPALAFILGFTLCALGDTIGAFKP